MKQVPLNLAFLGCGFATGLHSKTLSHFRQDVRCHYASRDMQKAIAYNQKHRGQGAFGTYEDAIQSESVDVVLIATPPAQHLELTLQALRAGKHVIVEKPPFLHASDFEIIRKTQTETGGRVLVAENYFYKPLAINLREILTEDVLGEVLFVHINALKRQTTDDWRDDPALSGGGALFEGGIHWVNFMANLGFSVRSARGFQAGAQGRLERSMLIVFEYTNNVIGSLHYSWETHATLRGLRLSRIHGREGSITFESNGLFLLLNGTRKRLVIPSWRDIAGYRAMFRDFIGALRTGEEPQMTLDLAQRDLQLVEDITQNM